MRALGLGPLAEDVPGAASVVAEALWDLEPCGVAGVVELGRGCEVPAVGVGESFS